MKKIVSILLILFAWCFPQCYAEGNDNPSVFLKPNLKPGNGRPRVPDGQCITCSYYDGNICLDFVYSEGMCNLYVIDARKGEMQLFSFDSSELSTVICVGTIDESYISLITEYGNTYEGYILGDE